MSGENGHHHESNGHKSEQEQDAKEQYIGSLMIRWQDLHQVIQERREALALGMQELDSLARKLQGVGFGHLIASPYFTDPNAQAQNPSPTLFRRGP